MADYLFTILDSRTLTNFSFKIPLSSPQNPSTPLPSISFDNSRRIPRKRKKKSLRFSLPAANNDQEPTLALPSSSNLVIVSSHEHRDGSFTFRFGDPSEVVKEDELKESDGRLEEEVGTEGKEEFEMVKVLDGQYEREVIVKRIEREDGSQVKNKAADAANSAVAISSGSSRVVDEVSESCDGLLEDPKQVELAVSAPSSEVDDIEIQKGSQETNEQDDVADAVVAIGSESSGVTGGVSESSEKLLEDPKQVELAVSAPSSEVDDIEMQKGSQETNEQDDVAEAVVAIGSESSGVTGGVSESSEKLLEDPKQIELAVSAPSSEVDDTEILKGSQETNGQDDVADVVVAIGNESSGVSESSEKLLEDPKHVKFPVSASSIEVENVQEEEGSQGLDEVADVAVAIGCERGEVTDEVSESIEKLLEDQEHVELPVSASRTEVEKIEEERNQGPGEAADEVSESSEKLLEDPKCVELPVSSSSTEVDKVDEEEGSQVSVEAADAAVAIGCESSEKLLEAPKDFQSSVSTWSAEVEKIEREEESQGSNEAADVGNSRISIDGENSRVTIGANESSVNLSEDPKEVQLHDSVTSVSSAEIEDSSSSEVDIENSIHDEEIPTSVVLLDKSSELENSSTYGEVLGEKSGDENVLQSVSLESDLDTEDQANILAIFEALNSSTSAQDQGMESVLQNEPEDNRESYAVEVMTLSPSSESKPILNEEAHNDNIQEFGGEDTHEKISTISNLPNRILKAESSGENSESSNLLEVLDHELTELESTDLEAETSTNKFPISDLPEVSDFVLKDLETTEVSLASEQIPTQEFVLSSAAALLPHPAKVLTGGEDAYFIGFQNWLGVADGVGQWSLEGSKPGVYAQEIMDNCERVVSDSNGSITTPEEVLRSSIAKSQSCGFSTVLVSHFDGQVLHIANIGDSGFVMLRNGAVHKKSSAMFHEFSFPIQIGRGDDPSQLSEAYKVELDEGDIIVIATDGLFNNLYVQEIASIVSKSLESAKGPKEIAEALAKRAQEIGSSAYARSPFADSAQAAGYAGYSGGKLDDVTVIVSLVQKAV